jgi:hypothetical protein
MHSSQTSTLQFINLTMYFINLALSLINWAGLSCLHFMTLDRLHLVSLQIAHLLFSHRSELTLGFWKAIELTQFALHIAVFILKAATVLLLYAVHNLILVLLWAIGAIMVFIVLVTIYRLVQLVKNRYEVIKKTSHVIQGLVKKIVIYS